MMKEAYGGKSPKPKSKSPKMKMGSGVYAEPEEEEEEGDGAPMKSDSAGNKQARRQIFMKKLMGKK